MTGIHLVDFDPSTIEADGKVADEYNRLRGLIGKEKLPSVNVLPPLARKLTDLRRTQAREAASALVTGAVSRLVLAESHFTATRQGSYSRKKAARRTTGICQYFDKDRSSRNPSLGWHCSWTSVKQAESPRTRPWSSPKYCAGSFAIFLIFPCSLKPIEFNRVNSIVIFRF